MVKIGFTTSRSPVKKTRSFIRDIIRVVPSSYRIVRGSSKLLLTLTNMKNHGFSTALVIHSVKGNPNFIRIFDLESEILELPFAIKVRGLTLSREYRKEQGTSRPAFSILISSLNNSEEEQILKRIFGITERSINEIEDKEYVTIYADYLDKNEGLIFIEFLDSKNKQVGPRIKLKVIPREPEQFSENLE